MPTLGNAAKTLGISQPSLPKPISRGHLSAAERNNDSFAIDPSELAAGGRMPGIAFRSARQATASRQLLERTAAAPGDPNTLHELGVALRELLEAEQRRSDDQRRSDERRRSLTNEWREQAQRLLLAAPWVMPPTPASAPAPVTAPPRTSWWGWWRQAS
jgi:hypothetical protein